MKLTGRFFLFIVLLGAAAWPSAAVVRGRVQVLNNAVLAENGEQLRCVSSHMMSWTEAFLDNVSWWRQVRDIGHFNCVRVMAYLGDWPKGESITDISVVQSRLDGAVAAASQTGMYLIIDNHSECCGSQDVGNDTAFWNAVAPRYKDNTNVIYELKNEPDQSDWTALSNYEAYLYSVIRGAAPNTHIIMWSVAFLTAVPSPLSNSFTSMSKYTNASVGFHLYGAPDDKTATSYIQGTQALWPVIMTEFTACCGVPGVGQSYLQTLDTMGLSWVWLDGTGFTDGSTGDIYGQYGSIPLAIFWGNATIRRIANGGSNLSGGVAPGEIVVIYGSVLGPGDLDSQALGSDGFIATALAGTNVTFNGVASPLIYSWSSQVAAVVPYGISGSTAHIQVQYQGQQAATADVPLALSAPGLFTADSSGQGQAAAINRNGTTNGASQPIGIGDYLTLWATGEGQTSPQGVDGKVAADPLPKPNLPVTVTIGGVPATVQYAGGAPGEIAGLLQVNVQIPPGVQPGSAVPVVLKVGDNASQPGVTVAVSGN